MCFLALFVSHTYVEWMACVLRASGVYVFPGASHVQRAAAPESPLPDRTERAGFARWKNRFAQVVTKRKDRRDVISHTYVSVLVV